MTILSNDEIQRRAELSQAISLEKRASKPEGIDWMLLLAITGGAILGTITALLLILWWAGGPYG